jgi:O-methyltransferase
VTGRLIELGPSLLESGHCWVTEAPAGAGPGDSMDEPQRSSLRLFQDGLEIGPGHAEHDIIRSHGDGRFSHWGDRIYLSSITPDSCPDQHRYTALVDPARADKRHALLAAAAAVDPHQLEGEQRYAWGERLFESFVEDAKLAEYGRSYFRDTEFLADYQRFDRQNYRSLDRKFALRELLKLALRRHGDLAECGVFRGATAFLMGKAIRQAGGNRTLHLFDSFAGLSQPQAADGSYWQPGSLACSLADVQAALQDFADLIAYHPGWIPTRFQDVVDRRFCCVHIDVDLYQPTRDALVFFHPRMVTGGVIVCDDYGFDTCPGARRAMDEFFASRTELVIHLPTGQGIVFIDPDTARQE